MDIACNIEVDINTSQWIELLAKVYDPDLDSKS